MPRIYPMGETSLHSPRRYCSNSEYESINEESINEESINEESSENINQQMK